MDRGFVVLSPQASSGISRPTRTKEPNKTSKEEVDAENAVHAKRQRAGDVRELRKQRNQVQELITAPGVQANEVEAFHNFVSIHDNYLLYEESINQMIVEAHMSKLREIHVTV